MTHSRIFQSKRSRAFLVLLSLLFLPAAFLMFLQGKLNIQPLPLGEQIPSLVVMTLQGSRVSLADYQGKKYLLMFFTIECAHCRTELANLDSLYDKYRSKMDFFVVSLSSAETTRRYLAATHLSFQIFIQQKEFVEVTFRLVGVPAVLFVDERRVLRQQYVGARNVENDEKLLQSFVTQP